MVFQVEKTATSFLLTPLFSLEFMAHLAEVKLPRHRLVRLSTGRIAKSGWLSYLLLIVLGLIGCGPTGSLGPTPSSGAISVAVTPTSASVPTSQSQHFDATVQNDSQNKGVTWTLTQAGTSCSPACGSLAVSDVNSATYSAPASMSQASTVTVTATSFSDKTKSASAQVSVVAQPAPTVSVSLTPTSVSVLVSHSQQFDAAVQNDSQNKGVTWTLTQSGISCSPACGSLEGFTSQSAIYVAPATIPNPAVLTITATSLADNTQAASATVNVTSSMPPGSTSQVVDITKYGARSVERPPTAMASCTSGSTVVKLSNGGWPQDFTQFENGDSIRLDNCGLPTAMTPPTGVIVSPGMNAGGTPAVSGLSPGATAYSYQVIACDKSGGCSSASAVTSTASGSATLGRVTAPIVSMSLTNNIMTVITAKAHGFVPNALSFIQYFSTQTAQFEGSYIVRSDPSPTTFTFLTSIDSRIPGTPTLDTSGGTAVGFNCNVVSWTPMTKAWKYFIYGRDSKAMSLIGVAEPGTTSWQDYGSTMMGNFSFPSFVPVAPPSTALNQYLLTTISSGGGTNSVVVAAAVTNTVADVRALMGSDAAILAAFKAATSGTLFIPKGTYQVAGYLDVHNMGPVNVAQSGSLAVSDTIEIPSSIYWKGTDSGSPTAFQETPTPVIGGQNGSYPTIYITNSTIQFDHIRFNSNALNGTLLLYAAMAYGNPPGIMSFDYVQFSAGGGNFFGYMDRQIIIRTGGFDYSFSKCLFIADQEPTGQISDLGYTFLPSILFAPFGSTPTGSIHFRDSWFVGKSAVELNQSTPGSSGGGSLNEFYNTQTQNAPLPIFVASNYPNANTVSNNVAYFYGYTPGDYPTPMTGNWAANVMSVGLQDQGTALTGSRPLVVGNPTTIIGQSGGTAGSGPPGGGWYATGGSQVGYLLPPPAAAPLLTISAGGNVPVGNHTYQTTWTDAFGNTTMVGPSATVNIVAGMQTVTLTPPEAPAGALGWQYYRDGALTGPSSTVCGPFNIGSTETDTLGFVACGNSVPSQNNALSSGFGINGEEATQIELTSGGHKSVIRGTFTADRSLTVPDVSGTIAVKIANGTVAMPTDAIAAGSCSAIVNVVATGVLATDVVGFSNNAKSSADSADLVMNAWPTANNVNFQYCNRTASSITPLAATLNWQVVR